MPVVYDDLIKVARSLRRELDRGDLAFKSLDRMELTRRLRSVSGEDATRIKQLLGGELEGAMSAQGLRCYPSLTETTTGDRIRVFRAGSVASDLIDAVVVPSPEHDRELAAVVAKIKGKWEWDREPKQVKESSLEETLERVLPREKHLEFVRSLDDDPDLATT